MIKIKIFLEQTDVMKSLVSTQQVLVPQIRVLPQVGVSKNRGTVNQGSTVYVKVHFEISYFEVMGSILFDEKHSQEQSP